MALAILWKVFGKGVKVVTLTTPHPETFGRQAVSGDSTSDSTFLEVESADNLNHETVIRLSYYTFIKENDQVTEHSHKRK